MALKIKKFIEYNKNKKSELEPLSDDIEIINIEGEDDDKFDDKEFEIESIIDVIKPEDIEYGNELDIDESITTQAHTMDGKNYKRGDTIYITALLRKKGTTSFNSPSVQGVLKVRITDIYYGLQYLNKVIN